MSGLRLADPMWLLALPLVALLVWLAHLRGRGGGLVYSSLALLEGVPDTFALRVKRWLPGVHFTGLALIVGALARPQLGQEEFRIRREGIAILLAVDRSNSMAAMDFELDDQPASRLSVSKRTLRAFVAGDRALGLAGRPDDLVGLVTFGGFAESRAPLTFDHGLLLGILDDVPLALERDALTAQMGASIARHVVEEEGATAIGDAIALGVERLRESEAESRVMILLSDGENTAGTLEPRAAAELAAAAGVRVYTVGVGTTGLAPFRFRDRFGRVQLQNQHVTLDEETLRAIAERTDGRYFNAQDSRSLARVYAAIDELEKTEIEGGSFLRYQERFQLLLLPACALLGLALLLQAARFRSAP